MEYEEYMNTLIEQIQNKRAKKLVADEIQNHIEEQSLAFEAEGMECHVAIQEAVRQMGDPVDTGMKLNKFHKPKIPFITLTIALGLTLIGIIMQALIFLQIDNQLIVTDYLGKTISYNLVGFVLICLILNMDYTFIGRYAYQLYISYIILCAACAIFYGDYAKSWVVGYFTLLLYPIILAGLIYRNRNRGVGGITKCMLLSAVAILWNYGLIDAGMSRIWETSLIIVGALLLSIIKGIFGQNKRAQVATLCIPIVALVAAVTWCIHFSHVILEDYQIIRLKAILHPMQYTDASYQMVRQRLAANNYTFFGNGHLPFAADTYMYSDFILSSIFSWFGIAVGLIVILALAYFTIYSFGISFRQSNRIGMLVGSVCCISLMIRIVNYIANNFGCNIYYSTSIPFLTYGLASALTNAVFIGLILGVYRNSSILSEQSCAVGYGNGMGKVER